MHIDQRGCDRFSQIVLRQRTILDKHIHLHAVTESLMSNQTGHLRGADNGIFTRNDALCRKQFQNLANDFLNVIHHFIQDFRSLQPGIYLIFHFDFAIQPSQDRNRAFTPDITLTEMFFIRDEQLTDMDHTDIGLGFKDVLVSLYTGIADLGQTFNNLFDTDRFRQDRYSFFNKQLRLFFGNLRRRIY
ncbi:hypothetical protein SDC9_143828 [bioreactor metagenome]|uniref:Uncharacterized protein n=1 Tax=bioreactor metagenome TaxID=1076179 RepID=A0A645E764_9ZZZZ